jgi:hypothetical protein
MITQLPDGTFRIESNRNSTIEFQISFADELGDGETIADWDFKIVLKKDRRFSASVMTLTVGAGITKADDTTIVISPSLTQVNIPGGNYLFDMKTTYADDTCDYDRFKGVWIIKDTCSHE